MSGRDKTEFELPFVLTDGERISPLWIKIRTELEEKLNNLRSKNDNENLTERETAALRGRINCYKSILGLGNDTPPID